MKLYLKVLFLLLLNITITHDKIVKVSLNQVPSNMNYNNIMRDIRYKAKTVYSSYIVSKKLIYYH